VLARQTLERDDLLTNPAGFRGTGRADHDQCARRHQRTANRIAEIGRSWQLGLIPENGQQPARNHPLRGHSPNKSAWNAIAFELTLNPFTPFFVLVAVTDKPPVLRPLGGRILLRLCLVHRCILTHCLAAKEMGGRSGILRGCDQRARSSRPVILPFPALQHEHCHTANPWSPQSQKPSQLKMTRGRWRALCRHTR